MKNSIIIIIVAASLGALGGYFIRGFVEDRALLKADEDTSSLQQAESVLTDAQQMDNDLETEIAISESLQTNSSEQIDELVKELQ